MSVTITNKWTNQKIKKKFQNRSCGSRAKKAVSGRTKSIPSSKIRGWIRRKESRQGKVSKQLSKSHFNLRRLQYGSVNDYEYITFGDGYDDYDEQWWDNIHDPWRIQQTVQIKKKQFVTKTKVKQQSPSPKPIKQQSASHKPLKPMKHKVYAYAPPQKIKWSSKASMPKAPIQSFPLPQPMIPKMVSIESMQQTVIPTPPKPKLIPLKPKNTKVKEITYTKTAEEEKQYSLLSDTYISAMSEVESYGIYSSIEGLADRSTYKSHKNDTADPTSDNIKKIMKEIRKQLPQNIYTSLNGSMFVRFDEENPRFLQCLLTGIDDTPYAHGMFLFDIYLCDDYPNKPLMIKHISKGASSCHANNGPGGFSPNLHQGSGKVCLSLLGTWSGPGWEKGKSNVYQVVSTIMFMIFGALHPYYMEPGCGGWEGTTMGRKEHERRVIDYDEEVMYHNAKYSVLQTLREPYVGFEEVIRAHFRVKGEWIVKTMEQWIGYEGYTQGFKDKMKPVLEEIKEEFEKLKKV